MISFQNVSFGYSPASAIFCDLTLDLRVGKTTALMGPSGSGKTTLLKLACALLLPTRGQIYVYNEPIRLGSVRGVVFQEDTLLPWLSVLDNVLISTTEIRAARDHASTLLTEFGLAEAAHAYPHELSVGMRKRVEFARALLSDSRALMLDEPFVSLDRQTREQFWKLWHASSEIASRTKLIVTHDLKEVLAIADDVVVLESGRPVTVRPKQEVASLNNGTARQ